MSPKIAIGPAGAREWMRDAVTAGGGELVDLPEAEAMVWAAEREPATLAATIAEHPHLRWVQLPWAGIEPYVDAGVLDDGRTWTCGKGVYARPVAEHALALALAGLRDLGRCARRGRWGSQSGLSLHGGRVAIFGAGGITTELLALLEPFGVDVTVVRRTPGAVPGARRVLTFGEHYEALKDADVVFLALALTPETEGIISEVELELMAPHAWLVNVARGGHVVTEDLVIALREDVIGGAALDVTDPEPLPEGHPLWDLPNCLITPHTANTEAMAVPLLSERITANVRRFAAGEPLIGLVDLAEGY